MNRFLTVVKNYILLISICIAMLILLVVYFYRHRQPYTQNAFLVANTRPVTALVPGYVTTVHVVNNQQVRKNAPLFTIFQPPYSLKISQLEASIAQLEASMMAMNSQIVVLQSEVAMAEAETANARYFSDRAKEMYAGDAVSQAYSEEKFRMWQAEVAKLAATRNKIAVVQNQCTAMNNQIAGLQSELALAKIYLEQTVITALADGVIINMYVAPGGYYKAGDMLCAFVDTSTWWVQANFEETELSRIKAGQKALIYLWQYPGKTFHGTVEDIHWGVERRLTDRETGAPIVAKENQWFLLPQRFPVQIRIDDPDPAYPFHLGGSAYVIVDTSARLLEQILWRIYQW